MIATNRRNIINFAILAAIAPAAWPRAVLAQDAPRLIAPPATQLIFSRQIDRDLRGEATLSVKREYTIAFARFAGGFVVDGAQTGVEIVAPPKLEPFAQLERQRVDVGLFPLWLSPFGKILPEQPLSEGEEPMGEAVAEARRQIATQTMPEDERSELSELFATIDEAGLRMTARMPNDLFAPSASAQIDEHAVTLASGDQGKIITNFSGERDMASGLMRRAAREVVTEIGADRRRTLETWEMRAL